MKSNQQRREVRLIGPFIVNTSAWDLHVTFQETHPLGSAHWIVFGIRLYSVMSYRRVDSPTVSVWDVKKTLRSQPTRPTGII